jgi:hypothetical protein
VDPRAGLGDVEKRKFLTLPGHELRPLGHPARSQSLYRLHYPGLVCPTNGKIWTVGALEQGAEKNIWTKQV